MIKSKKFYGSGLVMLLLATLLLAACGDNTATTAPSGTATGAATTTGAVTQVSLALDWTPNTNHTGIFVALAKGWYKEEGIDLKILPYSEAASPESLILSGKADLGIGSAEGVVGAAAAGQPIVSVAAIISKDTSAIVTRKDSGITSPKMLDGKKYAGYGAAFEGPVISKVIKSDGGKGEFQNITANVFGLEAVLGKQADFAWIFEGWEGIEAQLRGVELNVIPVTKFGVPDRYTPVIETSADLLKSKGDALKRFMKATARGFEFAITNPKESGDLLISANTPGTFPNTQLVYKSQEYLSPRYKDTGTQWGIQTQKAWTDYPKFMFDAGILLGADSKPIAKELDYSKLFSNDLLPK